MLITSLYLFLFIGIILVIISHYFEIPIYELIAGILIIVLGLSVWATDLNIKTGEVWSVNTSSPNMTEYTITNSYSNDTGVGFNYWGLFLLILGLFLIVIGSLRMGDGRK